MVSCENERDCSRMTRSHTLSRFVVGCTAVLAVSVGAQATTTQADTTPKGKLPPAAVDTAKKIQTLFTVKDAILAAGVVGATVALFPIDRSLAVKLQNENTAPGGKALNQWANGFDYLALPGVYIIAPAFYLAGRITHNDKIKDLGWHTTEAAIAGAAITEVLKGFVGRSRPYVFADTNPHNFKFFSGFTSGARQSFPSGHATIAFAGAAAASSEVARDYPKLKWIVGPILYTSAAFVGLARMYQSQHWASDVVMGAGIGTFTGLKIVRYAHAHPDNWIDKIMIHTRVTPTPGGGGMMSWSAQF
jgi:membrane-associated phospholipid phosphatase